MTYRLIRCSVQYDLVIAVTPANAGPNDANATYYRCVDWKIGQQEPNVFHQVSRDDVMGYFSGQADGLGFGTPPDQDFGSLDEALAFRNGRRSATARPWEMPTPRFFELLNEAYHSSDAVDNFDLDSNNPESVTHFDQLLGAQLASTQALIEHCRMFGTQILEVIAAGVSAESVQRYIESRK